jgi:hypothetical protein
MLVINGVGGAPRFNRIQMLSYGVRECIQMGTGVHASPVSLARILKVRQTSHGPRGHGLPLGLT